MENKDLQAYTKEYELPQATYVMSRASTSHKPEARRLTERPGDKIKGFWFPVNRAQDEVFQVMSCTKAFLSALDTMNANVEHVGGVEGRVGAMYTLKSTVISGVDGNVRQHNMNYKITVTASEAPERFEYVVVFKDKSTRTTFEIFATGPRSCDVWVLYPERSPREEYMEMLHKSMCLSLFICPCILPCYPCCKCMHMSSMQKNVRQMADNIEMFLSTYTPPQAAQYVRPQF